MIFASCYFLTLELDHQDGVFHWKTLGNVFPQSSARKGEGTGGKRSQAAPVEQAQPDTGHVGLGRRVLSLWGCRVKSLPTDVVFPL